MKLKYLWFLFLIISYIFLNYIPSIGLFYSSLSTALIISFGYLYWKDDVINRFGLSISNKDIFKAVSLSCAIGILTYWALKYISSSNNLLMIFNIPLIFYHDFFYTLNEEMILGSLLLFSVNKILKTNPIISSFFIALLFSIFHYIFYTFFVLDNQSLYWTTLLGLFLVGVIRNNLIFISGNIAYSWAIHFGFVIIIFGGYFCSTKGNYNCLSEVGVLNLSIGSNIILGLLAIFSALTTIILYKKTYKTKIPDKV